MSFDFRPFEDYVAHIMDVHKLPGAAVAVAKDGQPVYVKGFGFRDAEGHLPVTGDTIFGTGSITKSFTAVALMQLGRHVRGHHQGDGSGRTLPGESRRRGVGRRIRRQASA